MTERSIVEQYMNLPWTYKVEKSVWEGEEGFWITVTELPDCSSFFSERTEGLTMMPELLRSYLEVAMASDAPIPLPESIDASDLEGQILVRLPRSLHWGVKNAADREKTSINQFAVHALTVAVNKLRGINSTNVLTTVDFGVGDKPVGKTAAKKPVVKEVTTTKPAAGRRTKTSTKAASASTKTGSKARSKTKTGQKAQPKEKTRKSK